MKGIPPEIDQLLWAVAEDESPAAGDEFVKRYPALAGELARRRQMIRGLRGGRIVAERAEPFAAPKFQPRPVTTPASPRTVGLVTALGLAAVAVAAYTVTLFATPKPEVKRPPAPVRQVPLAPVTPRGEITYRQPEEQSLPKVPPTGVVPPAPSPAPEEASTLKPVSFHVQQANILNVFAMLGAQAKMKIMPAPGFPRITLNADYEGLNAIEILQDLGHKHGFTAFDQGDGSILVIPAVDESAVVVSEPSTEHRPQETQKTATP